MTKLRIIDAINEKNETVIVIEIEGGENEENHLIANGFKKDGNNYWVKEFPFSHEGYKSLNTVMPNIVKSHWVFAGMFFDEKNLQTLKSWSKQ